MIYGLLSSLGESGPPVTSLPSEDKLAQREEKEAARRA